MKIVIEVIPHSEQRYPTVGDWQWERPIDKESFFQSTKDNTLTIKVSDLFDPREQLLVGIHELIEAMLCTFRGIDQETVDKFDKNYILEGEPGDDLECPYHEQHTFATAIERQLAEALWITWSSYQRNINSLLAYSKPSPPESHPDDDIPF